MCACVLTSFGRRCLGTTSFLSFFPNFFCCLRLLHCHHRSVVPPVFWIPQRIGGLPARFFFFFVLLFAVPHENMFPQLPASFLPLSTFMQTMNIYLHIASAPIPSSNLTDPTRRGQRIFKRRDDNLSKRGTRCFQTDTLVSHKADWSNELFWVPTNQRILRSNWKESTGWTHFFFFDVTAENKGTDRP